MAADLQYRVQYNAFQPEWTAWEDYDPHEGIQVDEADVIDSSIVQVRVKPTENLTDLVSEARQAYTLVKSFFTKE